METENKPTVDELKQKLNDLLVQPDESRLNGFSPAFQMLINHNPLINSIFYQLKTISTLKEATVLIDNLAVRCANAENHLQSLLEFSLKHPVSIETQQEIYNIIKNG